MSLSPVSSCSSLSPTDDSIGRSKSVLLGESLCEAHPGYLIKNEVCQNCNCKVWIQKSITINIAIGLLPWGKAPQAEKVNILSYKYCAKCNAHYKDSAIVSHTWSCCRKGKNSWGCSEKPIADMEVDCCVND